MIGIYKITCTKTNKVYIGQSLNLELRKTSHFNNLKNNAHPNKDLQSDFNNYGDKVFNFEILTECNEELLNINEKYYIDKYSSLGELYNIYNGINTLKPSVKNEINTHKLINEFLNLEHVDLGESVILLNELYRISCNSPILSYDNLNSIPIDTLVNIINKCMIDVKDIPKINDNEYIDTALKLVAVGLRYLTISIVFDMRKSLSDYSDIIDWTIYFEDSPIPERILQLGYKLKDETEYKIKRVTF